MLTSLLLPLAAGLALFLAGMKTMEAALHALAGPYLRQALERFTRTPLRGMIAGTGLTALVQSSSAVTVITIGLVNAGVMAFPQTLGIILGTNIGTCLTTELIGLNIHRFALPLLCASFPVWLAGWILPERGGRYPRLQAWLARLRLAALACCGFSCVLLGMKVMQSMAPALQSRGLFAWFVEQSQQSLLWGLLAGACLTALIQSSAAAIAMTMGLASAHTISVELGIAIVLGANVGTCTTAFLASLGGSRYGRLVAWSHILLNFGGAALFFPLITWLEGISALLAGDPSGQIAHAQTLFNLVSSFLALPMCYLKGVQRL
jgi:phosphate:Na+ symporter